MIITALMTLVALATTLASSWSDFRSLRIPNKHVMLIMAAFVVAYVASPESFGSVMPRVAAFGIILVVTYVMFCCGLLGAGDAKYAAAIALWTGLKGVMILMFYMAIVGGLLGALALYFKKKKPFKNPPLGSWIAEVQEGKSAVPYGIAISIGMWMSLFHTGFLLEQIHQLNKIIH